MTAAEVIDADWRTRPCVTVDEAGELIGLSRGSTYIAVHSGDIPSVRIRGRIFVPVQGLRRLLGEIE